MTANQTTVPMCTTRLNTFVPLKLNQRRGRPRRIHGAHTDAEHGTGNAPSDGLLRALARAHYWQRLLDDGHVASGSEIARREGLHVATVNDLLRMTLLDPVIVQSVVSGEAQSADIAKLVRSAIPTLWEQQRPNGSE